MNDEQKYKQALEKAREYKKYGYMIINAALDNIFPELKESEDERIKNDIRGLIEFALEDGSAIAPGRNTTKEEALSWLEKQDVNRTITHEEICKSYGISDIGDFSDGFHTFNGLYHQRMILFAVLVKTYKDKAWKSWKHEDGLDCFGGGWFIVGIDTPVGTYTYHYKAKDWNRFDCQVIEKAKHWDGHDETDVERLFTLVQPLEGKTALEAIKEEKVDNANKNIPKFKAEDWYVSKVDGKIHNFYYSDKIEPKFKIGAWICNGGGNPCKVNYIFGNYYELCSIEDYKYNKPISDVDANYHLWSIEDVKPGDILSNGEMIVIFKHFEEPSYRQSIVAYVGLDTTGNIQITDGTWILGIGKAKPATKEERELLFKKIEDNGYEWDAEKKELKTLKE